MATNLSKSNTTVSGTSKSSTIAANLVKRLENFTFFQDDAPLEEVEPFLYFKTYTLAPTNQDK